MADKSKDLAFLKSTVEATASLIAQLQASTKADDHSAANAADEKENPKPANTKNINAIDLASDAASLIRAHSTKLSLLSMNKPFTPSAISKILRELCAQPLPALAHSVEICNPSVYTQVFQKELQYSVVRIFTELSNLLKEIPLTGEVITTSQARGTGGEHTGKGTLASTGTLWEACDAVTGLKKSGIAGLVIKKALQYQATLKDALEELQEWGEEEDDDDDDDDGLLGEVADEDAHDRVENEAQDAIDEMFGSTQHIPRDDPHKIRERLNASLRRLKLIGMMYQAVVKRRFKTMPALPVPEELGNEESGGKSEITTAVDEVMCVLKKIPAVTDELANAFYELDVQEIDARMDEVWLQGWAAVELLVESWEGKKDEFSDWAAKFQAAMKKGPEQVVS